MRTNEASFPGWPSGSGRCVCLLLASIDDVASALKQPIIEDEEYRYIWVNSSSIGNYTISSDTRETALAVQLFVDNDCDRWKAFKAVLDEVATMLPKKIAYFLQDDHDVCKRLEVLGV